MQNQEIAKKLLEAYEKSRLSYADLSRATGIPKSMIQRYFTGSVERIPVERLEALCGALGLDVEELLGWDNSARKQREKRAFYDSMTPMQAILFDASKDLTENEQQVVLAMITALRATRGE